MLNWIDNTFFIDAKNVFQLGVFNQNAKYTIELISNCSKTQTKPIAVLDFYGNRSKTCGWQFITNLTFLGTVFQPCSNLQNT